MTERNDDTVALGQLDLGSLAYFTGLGFNEAVSRRLHAAGYPEVRSSHGFVVQHLLAGPRSAVELAARMGISQQAASKRIHDMLDAGLLEEVEGTDARRRTVALSRRGRRMVEKARALRRVVVDEMLAGIAPSQVEAATQVLRTALRQLGMEAVIAARNVREHA